MRRRALFPDPQINLTPLIDVVFVILVMFMIIVPMLRVDKIDLATSTKKESPAVSEFSLHLFPDGTITLNSKQIPLAKLPLVLQNLKEKNPQITLALFPDKQATFGSFQKIKEIIENVGFEKLDIIVKPEG